MQTQVPGHAPIELPAYYEEFSWYYPTCEMQTKAWFAAHAAKDWVYLDCGANVGCHSILCAQLSPAGWVHAIEPTVTADMLATNLRHNGCKNATVHRVALGRETGRRQDEIYRLWGKPPEKNEYEFTTIDRFVVDQRLDRVDCVKIDVDSFDFEVLQGAEKTLQRFDPWVLVELSDNLALRGSSPGEVLDWLEARGYQAATVLDRENFVFRRATRSSDAVPIPVLRWALEQGCLQMVGQQALQLERQPAWAGEDYAATAVIAGADCPDFVRELRNLLAAQTEFPLAQLFQYAAVVRHFAPDIVLELGGGRGVTSAALMLGLKASGNVEARLVSCRTTLAEDAPHAALLSTAQAKLFAALPPADELLPLVVGLERKRVLIFANDPAEDATNCLLGAVLPALCQHEHLVIAHGISDGDHAAPPSYAERPGVFVCGNVWSARPDLSRLIDFVGRNGLDFFSAGRSLRRTLQHEGAPRTSPLQARLGPAFTAQGHWRWFTFNARHNYRYLFPPA